MPAAEIYYAVKANPAAEVVAALAELGANFDLASAGEIDICVGLEIPTERLSFGNTVKREGAIARASTDRIGLFAFDSIAELEKLARSAPGARVFCRRSGILRENIGALRGLNKNLTFKYSNYSDLLRLTKVNGGYYAWGIYQAFEE
jgi:hypothetical protein